MIKLSLFPIWIIDILGSALVILFASGAYWRVRKLTRQDPENALCLFFYWFTLSLLIFALSRSVGHTLHHLLVFSGHPSFAERLRPYSGGLNTITFVIIAAVSLFFYHIQRLYRRMSADHQQLETTSREILELNREMENLVMERTMSEMALGIADGIRNPLHVIGGFSHRLLRKAAPDDPAGKWAACIAQEAKRLEQMVEHFESLAQRKEIFFGQDNLNLLTQEILEVLKPEFVSHHLNLVTFYHPAPIYLRINKHLVKAALSHLLRNAIEATPPRGEIRVTTSLEHTYAVLTVEDTGRGMPQEVVEEVFVPFYTTKIGGSGLGMVFVRQIVDEHRGQISLDSQMGRGTKVTIRFPLRFKEAQAAHPPTRP
jgi:signal transduction histidine kinase